MTIRTFALLFVLLSSFSFPSAAQEIPEGWLQGGITAINLEQRGVIISEKKYRVALRARITDYNNTKLELEDLDMFYIVAYRVDEESGDILDLNVIVYP